MPWHVEQNRPDCDGWAVVKDDDGTLAGCHPTEQAAAEQMQALYVNEPDMAVADCPPGQHKMPDGTCMPDMAMAAEPMTVMPAAENPRFRTASARIREIIDGPPEAGFTLTREQAREEEERASMAKAERRLRT